jgi:predicted Fe-Mo cluster-binding NifX family protein
MLIAVASRNGKNVDQHFGRADKFYIFEVAEGDVRLVAERPAAQYCQFDPKNPTRNHTLTGTSEALQGCRAVVSAQIGDCPRMQLEQMGIDSFISHGPIKDTLLELAKFL